MTQECPICYEGLKDPYYGIIPLVKQGDNISTQNIPLRLTDDSTLTAVTREELESVSTYTIEDYFEIMRLDMFERLKEKYPNIEGFEGLFSLPKLLRNAQLLDDMNLLFYMDSDMVFRIYNEKICTGRDDRNSPLNVSVGICEKDFDRYKGRLKTLDQIADGSIVQITKSRFLGPLHLFGRKQMLAENSRVVEIMGYLPKEELHPDITKIYESSLKTKNET